MKKWSQFPTAREKLVPIRHVFRTNISHFVKNAREVKFYVACMRILHIDKISPQSGAFALDYNYLHAWHDFINVQTGNR